MAEDSADLFLLLINPSGDPLGGETQDDALAEAGIEINDFEVSFGRSAVPEKDTKFDAALNDLDGRPELKEVATAIKEQRTSLLATLKQSQEAFAKLQDAGQISPEGGQTFSVKKFVDAASPALIRAYHVSCMNKQYLFKFAVVTSYRAGAQHPYFAATFAGVRMLSYKMSMSSPLPTEDIDFAFSKCQIEYWPQATTGSSKSESSVGYAWDFVKRAPWSDPPRNMVTQRSQDASSS